jgi:tripartite ATP-independent transporter DctM subunit
VTTVVLIGIFVVLMLIRVPVCVSIGLAVVAALVVGDFPLSVLPRLMIDGVDSFPLLAIPFFVLAGNLMNMGGMTERIFEFARSLFGPVRGGLAQVNIAGSMIFAGMSGAALADLGGMGPVEMKAMRANGYPDRVSAGVTLASCTVGPIIPPSIVLIIYGLATDVSVGRLFLAGVIPGILIGVLTMAFVYLWVRVLKTDWGQPEPFRGSEVWRTGKAGALALALPVIVLLALFTGVSTPTEVGALAAAYALLVGAVQGEATWQRLWSCLVDSVITTSVIMLLISISVVMGWIITAERVPHEAAALISGLITDPLLGLLVINVFLLLVGMFLETTPAILILSPILLPVAVSMGIDPVHFGVVLCFNLVLGIITPPMGIGLFVTARIANMTPEEVLRGTLPFLIPLFGSLLIISFVPQLSTWLPNLVLGPAG